MAVVRITQVDLDWLLSQFIGNLMAVENEYGGPREEYAAEEKKAKEIVENMKDILRDYD